MSIDTAREYTERKQLIATRAREHRVEKKISNYGLYALVLTILVIVACV